MRHARAPLVLVLLAAAAAGLAGQAFSFLQPTPAPELALERLAVPIVHTSATGKYVYAHDPAAGTSRFVCFKLGGPGWVDPQSERRGSFHADANLPAELRAADADYTGSGYDRGHYFPDRFASEPADKRSTYCLANVAPLHPGANRGAIRLIEGELLRLATPTREVYGVVAPAHLRSEARAAERIKGRLQVPTHMTIAALVVDRGQVTDMLAWIVPNGPATGATVDELRATVARVQEVTQLDLYPDLADSVQAELEGKR